MGITSRSKLPASLLILCSLATFSCKTTNAASGTLSPASVAFLTQADLATPSGPLNAEQQAEVLSNLTASSFFYNNQPPSASASSGCQSVLDGITAQATSDSVVLSGTRDVTNCVVIEPSTGQTVNSAKVRMYQAITCPGVDLSSLNGKTATATLTAVVSLCPTFTQLMNQTMDVSISILPTTAGGAATPWTNHTVSYQGNSDLTPCTRTAEGAQGIWNSGCLSIQNSVSLTGTGSGATTAVNSAKYTYENVVDNRNTTDVWHAGGQIQIVDNAWTGTVTYTGGGTAPTYTLTQAGSAAVTGSLTALSLTDTQTRGTKPGPRVVLPRF